MGVNNEFISADFVLLESLQPSFNARKASLDDFNAIRLHIIQRLVEKRKIRKSETHFQHTILEKLRQALRERFSEIVQSD